MFKHVYNYTKHMKSSHTIPLSYTIDLLLLANRHTHHMKLLSGNIMLEYINSTCKIGHIESH